jgi:excisionase family DNA binding protein
MTTPTKKARQASSRSTRTKDPADTADANESDLRHPRDIADRVWCPLCKKHVQLLRVSNAAKLVDVRPRTIYRYIDEGLVYALKVAGKTYRVCKPCLVREYPDS